MDSCAVQFGLGLIGIGRVWGHVPGEVPSEKDALSFLEFAFKLGVRYFDTAPSYGSSEIRFGKFLRTLKPQERAQVTVATKFGEHWDAAKNAPFVDHTYEAMKASLDRSMERLGGIECLQLHMARPPALLSEELPRAWDYAESLGIELIGPSVSDPESARIAIAEKRYTCLQIPLSIQRQDFADFVDEAGARGMWVAVNGPVARGQMMHGEKPVRLADAFGFILQRKFQGVILSGTRNKAHLSDNWCAFHQALAAQPTWDRARV